MKLQNNAVSDDRVPRQVRNFQEPILRVYYRYLFGDKFLQSQVIPGDRVLDIGCGAGRSLTPYDGRDNIERVGIDLSKTAASTARRRFSDLDATFAVGDGEHLPFQDDSFDIVQIVGVFAGTDEIEPLLRECKRVLHPGGTLIYNTVNAETVLVHKLSIARFPDTLESVLDTSRAVGFIDEDIYMTFFISRLQKKVIFSERVPLPIRWAWLLLSILINEILRRVPGINRKCGIYWVAMSSETEQTNNHI